MIASKLTQLEIEVTRILERLRRLEQIPLRSAAKLLHKSPDWVRSNLPVVILGAKSHRVRASDIEAFLAKRTIRPINGYMPSKKQKQLMREANKRRAIAIKRIEKKQHERKRSNDIGGNPPCTIAATEGRTITTG